MINEFRRSLWFPILSILAVYIAASMLLGLLLSHLNIPGTSPASLSFLGYVGSFLVTIAYAVALKSGWQIEIPSFRPEKWRVNPRLIVGGVILMLATGIVLSPLIEAMPERYTRMLESYMSGGFWPMLTAVVAAPVLEEFLFRGIIQKNLVRRVGPLGGIAIGALIFGAIHVIPQQVVYAGCLGLILGSIYYLTGSLNSAIAVHFVNNGLTSLLYMFFGTSTGIEREILGNGTAWYWAYAISLILLAGGAWYVVRRVRQDAKTAADDTKSPEN